jgi:hypothetical protein
MHSDDAEQRREAARLMGSAKTERKVAAARAVAESRRGQKWSEEAKAKLREAQQARRERERQEQTLSGLASVPTEKKPVGRPRTRPVEETPKKPRGRPKKSEQVQEAAE